MADKFFKRSDWALALLMALVTSLVVGVLLWVTWVGLWWFILF